MKSGQREDVEPSVEEFWGLTHDGVEIRPWHAPHDSGQHALANLDLDAVFKAGYTAFCGSAPQV